MPFTGSFSDRVAKIAALFKESQVHSPNMGTARNAAMQSKSPQSLERELQGWQVAMIAVSGIIGVTIFASNGEYLRIAGPAGLLTAIAFVAVTAICVMEGLSEMVVLWPVSNAMVEYVRTFVDEELGIVVGIAYWYTWASVIAIMLVVPAGFSTYWNLVQIWQTIIFYIICPLAILAINWLGVKWYGWVEGIGGLLKLCLVLGGAVFLFITGAKAGSANFNQGYQVDLCDAKNKPSAVFLIIPFLAWGFVGVEIVSVTAFEAAEPRTSLRWPSKWIAYIITIVFFLCGLGEAINILWNSKDLPDPLFACTPSRLSIRAASESITRPSFSLLVLAAENAGINGFPSFINACLIFSCLSAANTALYVSSRTLYGLCRELSEVGPWPERWLAKFGALDPRTRVPFWALIASLVSFYWLPFLNLQKGISVQRLLTIITTTASIGGVLVWASQCLAFIRYYHWFSLHKAEIEELRHENQRYDRYNRWDMNHKSRYMSLLSPLQPVLAYVGLLNCFLIVFVFSTATWWDGDVTMTKVAVAFTGPSILLLIWLSLKLFRGNRRFWVTLNKDTKHFVDVIGDFERNLHLRDDDNGQEQHELGVGRSASTVGNADGGPAHGPQDRAVDTMGGAGARPVNLPDLTEGSSLDWFGMNGEAR